MIALHAVALFLVAFSPVILWFMRHAKRDAAPPTLLNNLMYTVPFLLVGTIVSAILSVNGSPLAEWSIPTFAIIAVAFFAPSVSFMRTFSIVMFFVCLALCADGLWLRESNYTSSPAQTASSSSAVSHAILRNVGDKVGKLNLPPVDSPRPLDELVDLTIPNVESMTFAAEWHTPITGLFRIQRSEQKIWIVGMNGVAPQLETRPFKTEP